MPASINNNEEIPNNSIANTINNPSVSNDSDNDINNTHYRDDIDMEQEQDPDLMFDSDFDTDCNGFDGFHGFDDEYDDDYDIIKPSNRIQWEFYDEMNDLDALYKQIHSPSQQSDVFNSVLLAILRPIFYLICTLIITLFITYIIANHYGYDILQLITSILSSSYFLRNNTNNNINSIFFNNGS